MTRWYGPALGSLYGRIGRALAMVILMVGLVAAVVGRFPVTRDYSQLCGDLAAGRVSSVHYYVDSRDVKVLWTKGIGVENRASLSFPFGLLSSDPVGDLRKSLDACAAGHSVSVRENSYWAGQGLFDPLVALEYIGYISSDWLRSLVGWTAAAALVAAFLGMIAEVKRSGRWLVLGLLTGAALIGFLWCLPTPIARRGAAKS
jgi:hypothetical protein